MGKEAGVLPCLAETWLWKNNSKTKRQFQPANPKHTIPITPDGSNS